VPESVGASLRGRPLFLRKNGGLIVTKGRPRRDAPTDFSGPGEKLLDQPIGAGVYVPRLDKIISDYRFWRPRGRKVHEIKQKRSASWKLDWTYESYRTYPSVFNPGSAQGSLAIIDY